MKTLSKSPDRQIQTSRLTWHCLICGFLAIAGAAAADVVVTTSNDENNGSLDPAMGSGTSLREAVLHAPAGSTIVFAPALHGFVFALNDGQMVISRNLTIDGSTLSIGVEVNAQEMSRVFEVQAGKTVSMIRLRIVGGKVTGDGGGIRNAGNLTLRDCELTSNQATGGGGAIENSGTLSLNACTLAGNTAGVGGGGIEHASGVLSLTNCTMTGNSAQWGGAIDGDGTSTIRLYSCTLSGNHASDKGGGIEETTGTLLLENSIVAGNTATNSGPDLKASSINTQLGVSLISSTNGLGGSYSGIVGTADLMPINDYGGPTRTLLPLPGSPARNAGGATALTVDQRGLPRVVGAAVDIGAVEVQPPLVVTTDLDFGPGSLRHTVGIAPSGSTITFDPSLDGASIDVYPTMTGDGGPEVSNPIILDKCLIIDASEREDLEVVGRVLPAYHTPTELLQLPHETSVAIYNLRFTGAGGISGTDGPGAAIHNEGDLLLDHCEFSDNHSSSDGGAIFNGIAANLTLTRCLLSGNTALFFGGAILNEGYAVLENTIIAGNRSAFGGGIADCGKLEMTDSVVTGNASGAGGGGGLYSCGTLAMARCTVEGNDSHGSGSGLYLENGGSLTACTISGNRGEDCDGAGIFQTGGGLLTLVQCTISDNHAGLGSGGGIASHGALTVASCTIAGNTAKIEGGGISLVAPASLTLSNSIVAGNSAPLGADIRGAIDVQQGVSLVASTDGILNSFGGIVADPQLGPLALNGGPTLTRLPLAGSPAINAGGTTSLALDQRGYPRVVAGKLDIGAVETGNGIPVILVDTLADEDDGPGVGSTSLRDAITAALPGSIISFAPALNGRTITLTKDQLTVDKNLIIDATSLAGGITLTGNVPRAFEVGISRHASIRGLTVSGIRSAEVEGAAVMNSGNLELLQCRFIGNLAAYGGAVYNSGDLLMENCAVADNETVRGSGGGLLNGFGRADLTRCAFTGNVSDRRGGGIDNSGELSLTECRLESNFAEFGGGGLDNSGGKTSTVDRCTFAGNLSGGRLPMAAEFAIPVPSSSPIQPCPAIRPGAEPVAEALETPASSGLSRPRCPGIRPPVRAGESSTRRPAS